MGILSEIAKGLDKLAKQKIHPLEKVAEDSRSELQGVIPGKLRLEEIRQIRESQQATASASQQALEAARSGSAQVPIKLDEVQEILLQLGASPEEIEGTILEVVKPFIPALLDRIKHPSRKKTQTVTEQKLLWPAHAIREAGLKPNTEIIKKLISLTIFQEDTDYKITGGGRKGISASGLEKLRCLKTEIEERKISQLTDPILREIFNIQSRNRYGTPDLKTLFNSDVTEYILLEGLKRNFDLIAQSTEEPVTSEVVSQFEKRLSILEKKLRIGQHDDRRDDVREQISASEARNLAAGVLFELDTSGNTRRYNPLAIQRPGYNYVRNLVKRIKLSKSTDLLPTLAKKLVTPPTKEYPGDVRLGRVLLPDEVKELTNNS